MPTRGKTKTKGLVLRKGDWCCTCTHINIARRLKCQLCEGPKKCGTILDKTNLKCCQRRKGKKKGQVSKPSPTNLYEKLRAWSERNPLGINVNVVLHDKSWVDSLLECVGPTSGAHIHTNTSKWKFYKLNLFKLNYKCNGIDSYLFCFLVNVSRQQVALCGIKFSKRFAM